MIENPIDIRHLYPVRKSKKQKQAFREDACSYLHSLGYECVIEKGSMGAKNIVAGDPVNAKHLITAHYDTCAALPFPNLITPCNFWLYLLYQLAIALVLILPAMIVGIFIGVLADSTVISEIAYFLVLFGALFLLMYGPANRNNANDNTSGVVTVLEIARSIPRQYRNQVCFVLFDLEEAGLIGSASYRSRHKAESDRQLVWNLDCVGDGDEIVFFPSKKAKKDPQTMQLLRRCSAKLATKSVAVQERGFSIYPSDQSNFPYGVGIAAFHRNKMGLYLSRIHTKRDTVLDETNVNILRAAIISAITCDGVQ